MSYDVKTILYASDLSPQSPKVFLHAVGIAQKFGAKIHAVTVFREGLHLSGEEKNEGTPKPGEEKLRERIMEFDRAHPDYEVNKYMASIQDLEGDPAAVILRLADELRADLIVMGSRGHSALDEVLLGSVAHKVTMRTTIPIILVPFDRQ